MQVRREASSCESASELLKTLTTHDAWEAHGEQIYEELRAVSEGDADKSIYYSPAMGWMLEDMCADIAVYRRAAAATCIQACWRGAVGRVKAAQKMGWTVHGYRSEVVGGEHHLVVFAEPNESPAEWAATRIQACWRGMLGRDDYQAAWESKRSKEIALEMMMEDEACWAELQAASPPDRSAGQLVVGNTILGHSIANDEPLYGGKCGCVGLLTGVVPSCLGGSVTVFHGATEDLYHVVWDHFERYPDEACDVREMHRAKGAIVYQDISSLRQLLSLGPPYKPKGNVDLQTLLEERRKPLGYTNSGQCLVHSQDLIFMVAAAVFMQCDIVLLDSATAMLRHVIVRCQRPNPRRQRSCARAQLRSDDGAMGAHLSAGEGREGPESALGEDHARSRA